MVPMAIRAGQMRDCLATPIDSASGVCGEGMPEFTAIFETALSRINKEYFQIQIDGGDPVYRERVYCYELYHQLRCLWPPGSPYRLNGELDKTSHKKLQNLGMRREKPDLLVHQPGNMTGNYAVIEVKTELATPGAIKSDLVKLSKFISNIGYQRAIYLIYGYESEKLIESVEDVARTVQGLQTIELWIHNASGKLILYQLSMDSDGLKSTELAR